MSVSKILLRLSLALALGAAGAMAARGTDPPGFRHAPPRDTVRRAAGSTAWYLPFRQRFPGIVSHIGAPGILRIEPLKSSRPAHPGGSRGISLRGSLDTSGGSFREEWVRSVSSGGDGSNDVANAIAVDHENNVYVAGVSDVTYSGGDFLLIKYTPDGATVWTARFEGTPNSFNEPTSLAVDSAENVYVTGYGAEGNNSEYITVKYDWN